MYDVSPARTETVEYSPREWTRLLLDENADVLTDHAHAHVRQMLAYTEDYPDDKIAVSATPREATMIAAQMREYTIERGY